MIQFDILSVTVEILKCLKKSKKPDRKDWIKMSRLLRFYAYILNTTTSRYVLLTNQIPTSFLCQLFPCCEQSQPPNFFLRLLLHI